MTDPGRDLFRIDRTGPFRFPSDLRPDPQGRVAIGGDLSPETLIEAYRQGTFPWYETPPITWYSPDPRMVLLPADHRDEAELPPGWAPEEIEVRVDTCFARVIERCATIPRAGQRGTWIRAEIREAYLKLHERGLVHSVEVFHRGALEGGLYGVQLGAAFFGESMFSEIPGASRVGVGHLARCFARDPQSLIDCQIYSPYLARFGARLIRRDEFLRRLSQALSRARVPLV